MASIVSSRSRHGRIRFGAAFRAVRRRRADPASSGPARERVVSQNVRRPSVAVERTSLVGARIRGTDPSAFASGCERAARRAHATCHSARALLRPRLLRVHAGPTTALNLKSAAGAPASVADKPRPALLHERIEPLLRILGREENREEVDLLGEVCAEVAMQGAVRRLLRIGERYGALLGEFLGEFERPCKQLSGLEERGDETVPQCLLRVDRPAGQDQLLREANAGDAGEPLRTPPNRG